MPRKTFSKAKLNSTNFSGFDPGIASSPLTEQQAASKSTKVKQPLSKNELAEHLEEHNSYIQKLGEDCKENLTKYQLDMFEEFDTSIGDIISSGDFDFPVTVETLKVARSMLTKCKKGGYYNESKTVPAAADDNEEDSDSDDTVIPAKDTKQRTFLVPEKDKNKKVLNTESNSRDEESADVFKKPAVVTRKTRQASQALSKEYQTPKRIGYSRGYNIAKVTPGPDIDRPLSVLRRPTPGEMAVSMNGSPLVTTHDNIAVPQMTIPLSNGRVLTYLANDGLDPDESLCADISPETQQRLTVFYKLLERKIKKTA